MNQTESVYCDIGQRPPGVEACQDCGISDALMGHQPRCSNPVYEAARDAGEQKKAAQLAVLLSQSSTETSADPPYCVLMHI